STIAPCALLNPLVHDISWNTVTPPPIIDTTKLEDIFTHYSDDILVHSENLKQNAEHVYCLLLLIEAYRQGKLPLKPLDFQVELFLLVDPEIEDPRNSHQVVTSSNPDFEFLLILASLSESTIHFSPMKTATRPSKPNGQTSWEEESSDDPIQLAQAVILVPINLTKQPVVDHDQLEKELSQTATPQVDPTHDQVKENPQINIPTLIVEPTEPSTPIEETKNPFAVQSPNTPPTHEEILKALEAFAEPIDPQLPSEEEEVIIELSESSYSLMFPTLNNPPEPQGPSYYASLSPRRVPLLNPEKLRRRNLGLCLYCGLSGHQVQECLQLMHHPARIFTARELYPDRMPQAPPSKVIEGKHKKLTNAEKD
ncbi:hypothetical protein FRB99_005594, partial [Tulasnella sp. 403]